MGLLRFAPLALRCQGRQLKKRRPASADFLADAFQGFGLLSQHPRQFPQHFPRSAFEAAHCGSRFTLF